ncbi:terpene synthase family protein [Streptomyces sp. NPDC004610]|uniref:(-)-delta-cadinene synthase n=1 Tax=unclassified Streptomyces TaxID=2593676 RepID=UPI0033AD7035
MPLIKPGEESVIWSGPAPLSPHAGAADSGAIAWAEARGLCQDAAELRNLSRIRPGLLAGYSHPEATEADLTLTARWMAWLFLLDDLVDEGELGRDAALLEKHLHGLQNAALGTGIGADAAPIAARPMSRALAEIITEASAGMSDAWQLRFRGHVSGYLSACVWQAAHRQAAQFPAPDAFPHWRRAFGAIMPSFDLIERTDGGALPPSVYYSRPYQDLLIAAADLVCWTNDLMTVDKEAAQGDLHNLVLVTAHDRLQDLPTAAAEVSAACEQRIRTYMSARGELSTLTAALDLPDATRHHADRCAESLRVWIRGHLEWGRFTPRYQFEPPDGGHDGRRRRHIEHRAERATGRRTTVQPMQEPSMPEHSMPEHSMPEQPISDQPAPDQPMPQQPIPQPVSPPPAHPAAHPPGHPPPHPATQPAAHPPTPPTAHTAVRTARESLA